MQKVKNYFSLVTFSHTLFAMPFALIGFFLALHDGYSFKPRLLALVLLCMVFARNAAMAFNRYIDRHIDLKNPRTAFREIPRGILQPRSVLFFSALNSMLFILATFWINQLTFLLSPLALFVILGYSFTKRFTSLSHFILGTGLALAPVGAYLSVTATFRLIPVLFSLIVLFWVGGFDIIYALQDEDFDKTQNLHSIPVRFGRITAMRISALSHFLSASLVVLTGFLMDVSVYYWTGAAGFILLLIYQHRIIRRDDLSRINISFFTLNGIASVFFAFFTILDSLI